MLAHSSTPPSFWHHALQMATYLHNILPTKTRQDHSPTQLLYHKTPTYSHLRVFGSLSYPLFPSTSIKKLQARSTPCVFLGYPSNHRRYKCYDLSSKKRIISRHLIFDESSFPFAKIHTTNAHTYDFLEEGISKVDLITNSQAPQAQSTPPTLVQSGAQLSPTTRPSAQPTVQLQAAQQCTSFSYSPISRGLSYSHLNPTRCRAQLTKFSSFFFPSISNPIWIPATKTNPHQAHTTTACSQAYSHHGNSNPRRDLQSQTPSQLVHYSHSVTLAPKSQRSPLRPELKSCHG